jgi:hypothetical protein
MLQSVTSLAKERRSVMTIQFQCPQCAKSYELPDEMAGKTAKCGCGAQIAIPAPAAADPLAAAPVADPLAMPPVADPLAAPPAVDPLAAPLAADPLAAPPAVDPLVADPLAAPMQAPDAPFVPQQMAPTAGPWAGGQQQQGPETSAVPGESSLPPWLNAIIGKTITIRITRGVLVTIMLVLGVLALKEYGARGRWESAYQKLDAAAQNVGDNATIVSRLDTQDNIRRVMSEEYGAELAEGPAVDVFKFGGVRQYYWVEVRYNFAGQLLRVEREFGSEYPEYTIQGGPPGNVVDTSADSVEAIPEVTADRPGSEP